MEDKQLASIRHGRRHASSCEQLQLHFSKRVKAAGSACHSQHPHFCRRWGELPCAGTYRGPFYLCVLESAVGYLLGN